jgi:hypothetical protein
MPRGVKKEESLQMQDADYMPDASAAPMADAGNGVGGADMLNPDNITIKNHFPVARIKRIMQADDDVGKVAQVTPVVVCTYLAPALHFHFVYILTHSSAKALELFMISLVTKAAAEAKARNSKRVASVHLKQAITKTDRFDFLSEIVAKVADAPEKNDDAMDVDGKKKRAASRRKKTKAESDEDF